LRSDKQHVLKNRNFVYLLTGQTTSLLGNSMNNLALLWLMRTLTAHTQYTTLAMGVVLAAAAIPRIFVAPFAGVLVDRWSKRQLMIVSDVLRGGMLLIVTLLTFLHTITPWELVVVSFLLSLIGTVFNPANVVLRKSIVGTDFLLQANALLQTGQKTMEVAGPAIGGLLIGFSGMGSAFAVDSISFFVSAFSLFLIHATEPAVQKRPLKAVTFITDIKSGMQTFLSIPYARALTPFMVLYNLPMAAVEMILIQFVASGLHIASAKGAAVVGLLNAAMAVGELVGGALLSFVPPKWPKERLFVAAMSITALSITAIGFIRYIPAIAGLLFIGGFCMIFVNIAFFTGIQEAIPSEALGRVWALLGATFASVAPISQLLVGALATVIPTGPLISALGGAGFLIGVSSLTSSAVRNAKPPLPTDAVETVP